MRAPNSPTDYARGYDVLVSTNDISWTIVAACTGTANPRSSVSPTQTAQWVRVVLTARAHRLVVDRRVRPLQQRSGPYHDNDEHHDDHDYDGHASAHHHVTFFLGQPGLGGPARHLHRQGGPVPNGGTVNFYDNRSPIAGCDKVSVNTTTGEAPARRPTRPAGTTGWQGFYSAIIVQALWLGRLRRGRQPEPARPGYWLATANGAVYGLGAASSFGGEGPRVVPTPSWHSRHPDRQGLLGGDGQRQRGRLR